MTWTAPKVTSPDDAFVAGERRTLEVFLDIHRATFAWKCAGLDGEQLARRSVPSSNLSLLGLIRHLADAERHWFGRYVGGLDLPAAFSGPDGPDAAFDLADADAAEDDYGRMVAEWNRWRTAVAERSLDEVFDAPGWGQRSLRWVYNHLIEEYARHNGHADLLREAIDGAVGEWNE
jgi:uncharacterized damage-inducible protein DinB